jgi:hypothetical protein
LKHVVTTKIITKLFVIILIFFNGKLFAQQSADNIGTDRPDITESGVVIPVGFYQLENGYLFENQNITSNGIKTNYHNYTILTSMLRVGFINNVELRFAGDYLRQITRANNSKSINSGFNNLLVGAKYQFMKEESDGRDLGLLMQFYLPVGNELFKPQNIEPEALLAYGKDITEIISLSANIGGHWNSIDNILIFLYSASFGFEVSENLDSFIEVYGDASKGNQFNYNFDFGFAYRLRKNLQMDISAGNETSSGSDNYFISAGISMRFPE